jgi:CheY-like chemotaxis protein
MSKKILIVDDEDDITSKMSAIASREGYQPLTASDGTDALELLKTEPVDLVLSDHSMRELYGTNLMGIIIGKPSFLIPKYIERHFNGDSGAYDLFTNSHKSTLLLMMSTDPEYVKQRLSDLGYSEVLGCFPKRPYPNPPFDEAELVKTFHQYLSQ